MSISFTIQNRDLSDFLKTRLLSIRSGMAALEVAELLSAGNEAVKDHVVDGWFSVDLSIGEALEIQEGYCIDEVGGEFLHTVEFETDGSPEFSEGLDHWIERLARLLSGEERFRADCALGTDRVDRVALFDSALYEVPDGIDLAGCVKSRERGYPQALYVSASSVGRAGGALLSVNETAEWVGSFARRFELENKIVMQAAEADHDVDEFLVDTSSEVELVKFIRGSGFFVSYSEFEVHLVETDWFNRAVVEMLSNFFKGNPEYFLTTDDFQVELFDFGFRLVFYVNRNIEAQDLQNELTSAALLNVIGELFRHTFQESPMVCLLAEKSGFHDDWNARPMRISAAGQTAGDFSGETESISALLKIHGAKLSAVKANRLLIKTGMLEEKHRESTSQKGKMKKYKVLTDAGLKFGINQAGFGDTIETSPRYYTAGFAELLAFLIQNE